MIPDKTCPRCGTKMLKSKEGDYVEYFCPRCKEVHSYRFEGGEEDGV